MKRKKLKKLVCATCALLLALSASAYANQPYVNIEQPEVRQTQQPTEAPIEIPTDEPMYDLELTIEVEITPDPVQELLQKQDETNQRQEENTNLLSEIKGLIGGLFNMRQNDSGTAHTSNTSVSDGTVKTNASNDNGAEDLEKLLGVFMQMGDVETGANGSWIVTTPTESPTPTPIPKKTATDGNGYIIEDSQLLADGKEFLTMASKDGTEFYMIIDRAKDNEVYMLNKFDSTDLAAFIEDSPSPSSSPSPTEKPTATPKPTEEPTEGAEKSGEKTGVSGGTIFVMLLIAVGAIAGIYFFRNKNGSEAEASIDDEDAEEEYSEDNDTYELPEEEDDEEEENEDEDDKSSEDEESEDTE